MLSWFLFDIKKNNVCYMTNENKCNFYEKVSSTNTKNASIEKQSAIEFDLKTKKIQLNRMLKEHSIFDIFL